jgi:hypothetical protein
MFPYFIFLDSGRDRVLNRTLFLILTIRLFKSNIYYVALLYFFL